VREGGLNPIGRGTWRVGDPREDMKEVASVITGGRARSVDLDVE
jgi:hypothetical protein